MAEKKSKTTEADKAEAERADEGSSNVPEEQINKPVDDPVAGSTNLREDQKPAAAPADADYEKQMRDEAKEADKS